MTKKPIVRYALQWHPTKRRGRAFLHFADGSKTTINATTAEEFNAISNVLQQAPVLLYSDGTLSTDWEPVADDR